MPKPTQEDASIMLQLVQMWPGEASNWIHTDEFIPDFKAFVAKYPPGSEQYDLSRSILNWYETIGTLYKYQLFNEDLLFDWLAIDGVWERVKGHALGIREDSGDDRLYENFEAMAKAQQDWTVARRAKAA